ncbi:thiamine pyrophosphate-binding protein [Chloroflexota bacterium]
MFDGGEVLLKVLKSHGVEYIFSSPGSEWPPVWESLTRRYNQGDRTIKYINCRHETTAVAMALGYARVSRRLPAVLLHAAYRTQTPMIILHR